MRTRITTAALGALFLTAWIGVRLAPAAGPEVFMLVTEEEAALPNVTNVAASPDVSEGPRIDVASPDPGGTYRDGFPVDVRFVVGPSGLPVKQDSLKVIYKKMWGIDITDRLAEFIFKGAIRVPKADFPPGTHTVQIYIEDTEQNPSTRRVTVTVAE